MNKARQRPITPSAKTRVFIVDDHSMIRHGLAQLLGRDDGLDIVGEASGATEALAGVGSSSPDLVICDLSLAEGNGLELIREITANWPGVKVLVSSMHTDTTYAERALRAGASGYVTKEQSPTELIEAVQSVLQDRIYVSPSLSDALMHRALRGTGANGSGDAVDSLSERELQVFELLGDGLSTRQIAEKLSRSTKTIETHRENIKQKLVLKTSSELVHRAIRWKMEGQGIRG